MESYCATKGKILHICARYLTLFFLVHTVKVSGIQCFLDNNFKLPLKNIFFWVPQNIDSQTFRTTFIFGWTNFSTYYLLNSSLELQYRTHFIYIYIFCKILLPLVSSIFSAVPCSVICHTAIFINTAHGDFQSEAVGCFFLRVQKLLTWHAIVKPVGQSCPYDSHYEVVLHNTLEMVSALHGPLQLNNLC